MTWVLFGVMLYVAVQLAVGLFVARGMRNESDYLLAGRTLGLAVSTMTVFATWFGAETCVGSSGAIYGEGLSGGRADPFGYTLCILVMGTFFAATLWKRGAMTLGDLVRNADVAMYAAKRGQDDGIRVASTGPGTSNTLDERALHVHARSSD